jgi:hypothetical protein
MNIRKLSNLHSSRELLFLNHYFIKMASILPRRTDLPNLPAQLPNLTISNYEKYLFFQAFDQMKNIFTDKFIIFFADQRLNGINLISNRISLYLNEITRLKKHRGASLFHLASQHEMVLEKDAYFRSRQNLLTESVENMNELIFKHQEYIVSVFYMPLIDMIQKYYNYITVDEPIGENKLYISELLIKFYASTYIYTKYDNWKWTNDNVWNHPIIGLIEKCMLIQMKKGLFSISDTWGKAYQFVKNRVTEKNCHHKIMLLLSRFNDLFLLPQPIRFLIFSYLVHDKNIPVISRLVEENVN